MCTMSMFTLALVSCLHTLAGAVQSANGAFLSGSAERSAASKQTRSSGLRRSRPNILYVLADDWGWADSGWHREETDQELQTPNMDKLVKEGVELERHYVSSLCSPTRSAIQTGRNPIHVNVENTGVNLLNPNDQQGGFSGIPRDMTGIAEKMRHVGYATYMYGKWDAGMATPYHTPYGRGYENTLSYFGHGNDFWNHSGRECKSSVSGRSRMVRDLWGTTGPAGHEYTNPDWCSQENQEGCMYEDQVFTNLVVNAIENHAEHKDERPFFIFWAPHIVHVPLQVPDAYLKRFLDIDHEFRRKATAMLYFMDEAIGNVTTLLKKTGLWQNTLIVVHADNGGSINLKEDGLTGAGNNFPLKGGKATNWEGGVRANAFASGGFLPESVRGTKQDGLMAGWDWYATFASLAGVDEFDSRAAERGLPPQETYNLWPLISGETTTSPRSEIALGSNHPHNPVGALIKGKYKIVIGVIQGASWTGPTFPNTTSSTDLSKAIEICGFGPEDGCLYDIHVDPTEHENIATKYPDLFKEMLDRAQKIGKTAYLPHRGSPSHSLCDVAVDDYDGFFGPFVDASDSTWIDARNRYGEEEKRFSL